MFQAIMPILDLGWISGAGLNLCGNSFLNDIKFMQKHKQVHFIVPQTGLLFKVLDGLCNSCPII